MKKWLKWLLSILGVLIIGMAIMLALSWNSISILKGTEGINSDTDAIPTSTSDNLPPLEKGKTDYASWLGPNGDSRSTETDIITNWSNGLQKRWEINYLCQGNTSATWSAPVVQGNRLVVCGRDSANDLIFCLNPTDGTLLWHQSYQTNAKRNHGTGPRATPAINDDRVYTFGRSGVLACWSLFDGAQLWMKNITELGGKEPTWGYSSSPLVWQNYVIVQGGGSIRTIAFDKITGDVAWKSGNGIAGYAALIPMEIGGKPAILSFHGKGLAALEATDGHELWDVPWETSYDVNATTPLIIDDNVFITSGYKTGCMLLKVGSTSADSAWKNDTFTPSHSDAFAIDGYVYGYSGDSFQNKGTFKCIKLSDGLEQWSTNDMGWGTSLFVDGNILCCDIKGNIFLMKPDPKQFIKITELPNALGDIKGPVWTRPVIANGLLYLRFKQYLICYDIKTVMS
ncbi:PQQ-binding-like beta-propeller repeat protein [candidate division KSB1 bacterium]|nr:PQQ-binding-like beta-propeller repeat protein [candidate division KSB1 bacterium]